MYKLEIFTDQMEFCSAALIDKQPIDLDFLAYDAYTITSKAIPCKKGYFTHITDGGSLVADGVISDVQPGTGTVDISIRPLQALFDVEVFASPIPDAVTWLEQQITEQFIQNADELQNRPVQLSAHARTAAPLAVEGETVRLLDVMAAALTTYGIVCTCYLDMAKRVVQVSIAAVTEMVTLEADLPNVLDKSITLGDSYGAANKAYIRKAVEDEAGNTTYPQTAVFYLHPNGTIDNNDTDRIVPVFWVMKNVKDSETWEQDALEAATEELAPQQYDNEIILTYRAGDGLAHPENIPVGAQARILTGGEAYTSILTGRTIGVGTVELTFGRVRVALTKKMIMERRQ